MLYGLVSTSCFWFNEVWYECQLSFWVCGEHIIIGVYSYVQENKIERALGGEAASSVC
ncbi:hypothetical protein HNQ69_001433 [Bartonella callosciuri]|uniref:Uncharacterized protein n=1 Tax=Bartonella callosciuri TaxID=686223 RepID=A0A840NNI7_9HYPH|nr:hypothetical protein [Bartonella callosciuri]MBB5074296.1 hypothetical protein [Bartonella callosciuri]